MCGMYRIFIIRKYLKVYFTKNRDKLPQSRFFCYSIVLKIVGFD